MLFIYLLIFFLLDPDEFEIIFFLFFLNLVYNTQAMTYQAVTFDVFNNGSEDNERLFLL